MSDSSEHLDLDSPRTFYNPHPGFAGAAIPIPVAIRRIAEDLDGQTLSLRKAIHRLEKAEIGEISVVAELNFIKLLLDGDKKYRCHIFRVICYR